MSYKILTKNGIDNSNIDGARGEYFNSGMRDGIVQGILTEGLFTATASNIISLDTCELRIAGHRIVIDEPVYHTFHNAPRTDTRYAYVAQIIVGNDQSVEFSLFVQTASTPLIQNDLYKTISGAGTYQVEIGGFTLLTTLEIVDVVKTIEIITGAGGVDGDYIRIGEVTTTMLDAGLDAEVDIENVTNPTTGLEETNFNFSIPKTAGSVVNVGGQQVASVNFTNDPQTQLNNLNSNKVEKVEGMGLSSNDYTTDEKNKLAGIETGAEVNKPIDAELSTTSENAVQNKAITEELDKKLNISDLLNLIYPVGSIYISINELKVSPASFIGGSWEQLPSGYALWTASSGAGTTISAGLPNIQGNFYVGGSGITGNDGPRIGGAIRNGNSGTISGEAGGGGGNDNKVFFNAYYGDTGTDISNGATAHESLIYGNSETVQPPAYRIYAWKRVS